jgi:hypothetical protein
MYNPRVVKYEVMISRYAGEGLVGGEVDVKMRRISF